MGDPQRNPAGQPRPHQQIHSLTKGCWICNEIRRLGGDSLLNENGAAPILREGRGRRRKKGGRRPKQPERGRSQVKRVVLKARRAMDRGRSRGRSVNRIIIRTPPIILDTRLHDTHNKGTYICDDCEQRYHGPFQGEFIEGTRDMAYATSNRAGETEQLMQAGSVSTAGRKGWVRTRTAARVRPSDSPPPLGQQRSLTIGSISTPHDGAYATTATRTALAVQGTTSRAASYTLRTTPVQGRQESEGMLPCARSPRGPWRNGTWNARYLCRTCLVREWDQSPQEIDQWLTLHHTGAAKAASYQWRASHSSRSAWHGQWGSSSHGSGWNYSSGRWK